MSRFLYILLFSLISFQAVAQDFSEEEQYEIDSLNKIIENPTNYDDTSVVGAYVVLSEILAVSNLDTLQILAEKSRLLAEKALELNPPKNVRNVLLKYLAGALSNIGYVHKVHGDIPKTLEYWNRGLEITREIDDKQGLATTLNNLGYIFKSQGDIEKALEYYHESISLYDVLDDPSGKAFSLNNIGLLYYGQKDVEKALEYCKRSLKIRREIGEKNGIAQTLNNLGVMYNNAGKKEEALLNFQESLLLRKEIGNQKGIGKSYQHIGKAYCEMDSVVKGLEYLKRAFSISNSTNDKQWIGYSADNISSQYIELNQIDSAEHYANISMEIAQQINFPLSIQRAALLLSNIYEKKGNGLKALEMHKLYILMKDSVNNEANLKATAQQQAKYEYEKQKTIDDAENEKLVFIEKEGRARQKIIIIAITVGLGLVVVFLIFVFNRLQITRKQKLVIEDQKSIVEVAHSELEVKNKEITDSITYAKRIQEAILPTDNYVKKCLPNSFVFYQPKDIVAGDFYWVEEIEEKILFAVGDCTGHGVPGAMVSVVCHNAMDRSIREYKLNDPGQILDKTRELIVEQLNKSKNDTGASLNTIRDGMDIAFCVLDKKTQKLSYAGAFNPLWIIRKGSSEIEEIKADRQAIGRVDTPKPFQTKNVELKSGDSVYIFSDGYADQFGGVDGKKFKSKHFKKLLVSFEGEPMEEQCAILKNHFEMWKGDLEQLDDICVIGVKI